MTIKKFRLLFAVFLLFGCSNKDSQSNSYLLASSSSQFTKETDTTDLYYKIAKLWEQELQLSNLENGYESFELRIWFYPELLLRKKLFVITHSSGIWSAKAYQIAIDPNDRTNVISADSLTGLKPKSNWNTVENKLIDLQVLNLPNYSYIKGDILLDDGITYFAEVANRNSYRFSSFSNPQSNEKNNKDAHQWQALVDLIRQEFEISN